MRPWPVQPETEKVPSTLPATMSKAMLPKGADASSAPPTGEPVGEFSFSRKVEGEKVGRGGEQPKGWAGGKAADHVPETLSNDEVHVRVSAAAEPSVVVATRPPVHVQLQLSPGAAVVLPSAP